MTKAIAAAIDLGGTYIKGALVDQDGHLVTQSTTPTGYLGFKAVCDRIASFVGELTDSAGLKASDLVGHGIGSPGGIDLERKVITQSPNFPEWKNVPLAQALTDRGLQNVRIENDANLAALGECWVGAGREYDDMAVITLGTGVGGGLILGGRIWKGAWGMAGELGHITIDPNGPVCGCGNHGCLEAFANIQAIITDAKAALLQDRAPILARLTADSVQSLNPELVFEAAKMGDESCIDIYEKVGVALGIAIADITNVLNLPLIAIAGGIGGAFDLIGPAIEKQVRARAFREPAKNLKIKKASLGAMAGMLGAGRLVFQEFGG